MDVLKTRQGVAGEQLAVTTGYDRKGVPAFRSPRKSRVAGKGFENVRGFPRLFTQSASRIVLPAEFERENEINAAARCRDE